MIEATLTQCQSIWQYQVGDVVVAKDTLMSPENPSASVFTKGTRYEVLDVLPLLPALVVVDDEGERNKLLPDFLADHFFHKGLVK